MSLLELMELNNLKDKDVLMEGKKLRLKKKIINISSVLKTLLQSQNIITATFMQWWFTI